jgi:hypothetical protein
MASVLLTVMLVIDVVFENSKINIGFCFPDAYPLVI